MAGRPPAVSVIIPTHNRPGLVPQAIESALASLGSLRGEIIVVDDGSTDRTKEKLSGLSESRVQVLYQPQSGAPAARNRGIEAAEGEYIAFLDDDDRLRPGALQALYEAGTGMKADLSAGIIESPVLKDGQIQRRTRHPPPPEPDPFVGLISRRYTTQTIRFLSKGNLVAENRWREDLKLAQDLEYFIRIAGYARQYVSVDTIVGEHRRHQGARISHRHRGRRGPTTRLRILVELGSMLEDGRVPSTPSRLRAACDGIWNELHHAAAYGWTDLCEQAWRTIETLHPAKSYSPERNRWWLKSLDRVVGARAAERLLAPVRRVMLSGRRRLRG